MSEQMEVSRGRPNNGLHFLVGKMDGKLDALLVEVRPAIKNLDERVVRLERWQWGLVGAGGIVSILLTGWEIVRGTGR